jgi:hypothetical protein
MIVMAGSASDSTAPANAADIAAHDGQATSDPSLEHAKASSSSDTMDRGSLLDQARAFVRAPHVVNEDAGAKRTFLLNKGLTSEETERVLAELVSIFYS